MGPADVSDRAAAGGETDPDRVVDLAVQEQSAAVRCRVATALARHGRQARALWISAIDRVVATRRLESKYEARLPAVHGTVGRAHEAATQASSPSARNDSCGNRPEAMLEHGFYERQVSRWAFRILTVVDQFTRECICLEADRFGMQVAQVLDRAKVEIGRLPASITVDNGTEFCSCV